MAVSLDGKIASHYLESDGERRAYGFTSPADRERLLEVLHDADAVILGANSLRVVGKAWAVKNYKNLFPTWIILTTRGLAAELPFWSQTSVPRWLVSPKPISLVDPTVKNLVYREDESPASFIYDRLKSEDFGKVILFGGGTINRFFYESGLVNRLKLTICPFIFAGEESVDLVTPQLLTSVHLRLLSSKSQEDHVFSEYMVQK